MLRTFTVYAVAVLAGLAAPVLVLAAARTAAAGQSPALVATAVVLGLGAASALLASALPRGWIAICLIVSLPIILLCAAMFFALAQVGNPYYVWIYVGIGSLASSVIAAAVGARVALRKAALAAAPGSGAHEKQVVR